MSVIFTVKPAWPVLPRASVAEQVTSVDPTAKAVPDAGEQVTGRVPSTMSVAVGAVQLTTVEAPVASRVMSDG